MSVTNFTSLGDSFNADVTAENATSAREQMVDYLGGENTPEYIGEGYEEIAIKDVIFGVSADHLHDDVFSVTITPAE